MWLVIKGLNLQDLSSAMSEVKSMTLSLYQQVSPAHCFLNIQTDSFHFVILEAKKSVYFDILFLSFMVLAGSEASTSVWKDSSLPPLSA